MPIVGFFFGILYGTEHLRHSLFLTHTCKLKFSNIYILELVYTWYVGKLQVFYRLHGLRGGADTFATTIGPTTAVEAVLKAMVVPFRKCHNKPHLLENENARKSGVRRLRLPKIPTVLKNKLRTGGKLIIVYVHVQPAIKATITHCCCQ